MEKCSSTVLPLLLPVERDDVLAVQDGARHGSSLSRYSLESSPLFYFSRRGHLSWVRRRRALGSSRRNTSHSGHRDPFTGACVFRAASFHALELSVILALITILVLGQGWLMWRILKEITTRQTVAVRGRRDELTRRLQERRAILRSIVIMAVAPLLTRLPLFLLLIYRFCTVLFTFLSPHQELSRLLRHGASSFQCESQLGSGNAAVPARYGSVRPDPHHVPHHQDRHSRCLSQPTRRTPHQSPRQGSSRGAHFAGAEQEQPDDVGCIHCVALSILLTGLCFSKHFKYS